MSKKDPFYPMMMEYEVNAFLKVLLSFPKDRTLTVAEWGSGRSTIYFTRLLKARGIPYLWVSVEHNPEWHAYVNSEVKNDKSVVYRHVPKEEKDAYIRTPRAVAAERGFGKYDLALVDGIYRTECLAEANEIAAVTLLHDAQRKSYGAKGTFIGGRLLKVGPDNPLSRLELVRFRIHEILWKLKQLATK